MSTVGNEVVRIRVKSGLRGKNNDISIKLTNTPEAQMLHLKDI